MALFELFETSDSTEFFSFLQILKRNIDCSYLNMAFLWWFTYFSCFQSSKFDIHQGFEGFIKICIRTFHQKYRFIWLYSVIIIYKTQGHLNNT